MLVNDRLLDALSQQDPELALRQIVRELTAEGHSKDQIYGYLETLLLTQRKIHGADWPKEDAILDTMDGVEGWCHPSARLFPTEQSS